MELRAERVIDIIVDFLAHENKNIRAAASTILLNYSIVYSFKVTEAGARVQILASLPERLDAEEDEAIFLKLVTTAANLCYKNPEAGELAGQLDLKSNLGNIKRFSASPKYELLQQFESDLNQLI